MSSPPRGSPTGEIAILIPVWNDAGVIERTLRSLHDEIRGVEGVEVIAIAGGGDGSYPLTTRLFEEIGLAGRVLLQEPLGKNAALNRGLEVARRGIVVFLDADTEVEKGWLASLCDPIATGRADATAGFFLPFRSTPVTRIFETDQLVSQIVLGPPALFGGGTIAVGRDALEAIGGRLPEDVLVGVDWDLSERLKAAGLRVAFADAARVKTEIPQTWREYFKDEVRWRRAYLVSEFRRFSSDRGPARLLGLLYVPVVQGLLLTGWALLPGLAAGVGWPAAVGLLLWLVFAAWVLLRHAARCLTAYAYTGHAVYLRVIPAYAVGFVVSAVASWTALFTLNRLSPHFKGRRAVDPATTPGNRTPQTSAGDALRRSERGESIEQ